MRTLLFLSILALSFGFFFTQVSHAGFSQAPLWGDDFGDELEGLTGENDAEEMVSLPFPFPFNGNTYSTAYVGTNGCIQFDGLGVDDDIDYDLWEYMEEFLADSDPDNPIFCPFNTDLSLVSIGTIYYNDSGNPLIFTWDGIGTFVSNDIPSTFQLLIYQDGRIVISYNGMMVGGDFLADLDEGIVAGITPSDFTWDDEPLVPGDPGPNDLNGPSTFYDRATIYERWCFDEADSCGTDGDNTGLPGPVNTAFDLDFHSICFVPQNGGFDVSSGGPEDPNFTCGQLVATQIPTLSEWGMIAMAGLIGIIGLLAVRRKKAAA